MPATVGHTVACCSRVVVPCDSDLAKCTYVDDMLPLQGGASERSRKGPQKSFRFWSGLRVEIPLVGN
jgi:hypothetical protein